MIKWTRSLKTRITGIVLIVLAACVSGGIAAASAVAARAMERSVENHLLATTDDLAGRTAGWFFGIRSMLELVRQAPDLASMDPARQVPVMKATAKTYPEMYLVMTTDAAGMNVSRSDGKKLTNYGDRSYVKQLIAGKPFASQTIVGKTTGRPAVAFAVPILRPEGGLGGVLAAVTETTRLTKAIGAVRIGETGLAFLVDSSGKVIAHPEAKFAKELKDFSKEPAVQELRRAKRGLLRFTATTDPRTGAAIAPMTYVAGVAEVENGWGVVVAQQEQEAFAQVRKFVRYATLASALALLLMAALLWRLVARALRPVEQLMNASRRLAEGNLDERVSIATNDEIGALGESFNSMASAIGKHVRELAAHQASLEETVRARTAELSERNEEMRLVLDTVDQGLVVVDRAGRLGGERSARFNDWFPEGVPGTALHLGLSGGDSSLAANLQLGWEAVIEDLLPLELNLAQLPTRVRQGDRELALAYRPVLADGVLSKVLVVVSDLTAELQRQRGAREQLELLAVFQQVMRDRTGFVEFFNDAEQLVTNFKTAHQRDVALILRDLHTLKGNAAIMGVSSVAQACHDVETSVAELGRDGVADRLDPVIAAWADFAARVVPLMGTEPDGIVELSVLELEAALDLARHGAPSQRVAEAIELLLREPARVRLGRAAEQAKATARRLGKLEPTCVIEGGDLRLPLEDYAAFWSTLVHAVRNAIDHGMEAAEERTAQGKPPRATLTFRAAFEGQHLIIELSDDGRGIDWPRIRAKAQALGLPHESARDLSEALFADGLSTAERVTETSGRGVGMRAMRDAVQQLNGIMEVSSKEGQGTTIRVRFHRNVLPVPAPSRIPAGRPSLRPPSL